MRLLRPEEPVPAGELAEALALVEAIGLRAFDSASVLPFVEDDRPTLKDVTGPGDRGRRT